MKLNITSSQAQTQINAAIENNSEIYFYTDDYNYTQEDITELATALVTSSLFLGLIKTVQLVGHVAEAAIAIRLFDTSYRLKDIQKVDATFDAIEAHLFEHRDSSIAIETDNNRHYIPNWGEAKNLVIFDILLANFEVFVSQENEILIDIRNS